MSICEFRIVASFFLSIIFGGARCIRRQKNSHLKKWQTKRKRETETEREKKKREFVFVEKSSRLLRVMKAPSSCVSERQSYNHTHEVHIHNHRQHVVEANAD